MITTPDYLGVFKIPALRGRAFNDRVTAREQTRWSSSTKPWPRRSGRKAIPSPTN
jgi:hypothetical protein